MRVAPIPGFPGHLADSAGRIWTTVGQFGKACTPKLLRGKSTKGHILVYVHADGERRGRQVYAHRLVCMAYNGQPTGDRPFVRHLNGVHYDNRPVNLAWGTMRQNAQDTVRHGHHPRHTHPEKYMGERNSSAKLKESDVLAIRQRFLDGEPPATIVKDYPIARTYIYQILKRKSWDQVRR